MQISAPLFVLKRQARLLSRQDNIPLHEALDRIARQEGFNSWSLLASHESHQTPAQDTMRELKPGELLLLGARPGQGKTVFGLQLCLANMKRGHACHFFSLDYVAADIDVLFTQLGESRQAYISKFAFDDADQISAAYIQSKVADLSPGSMVVVDYLQALELDRRHPLLQEQLPVLHAFARERGLIFVFIAQISRRFDTHNQYEFNMPSLADVKVVNAFDLGLFDRTCFIHEGQIELSAA